MPTKFDRFKDSYFKHFYPDGPDLAVLDELDEKELKEAETLLIASLKPNEVYLIQALGYLRSKKAFPKLVELLPRATGLAKVYVAEALWRINNYKPALVVLCETLTRQSFFRKSAANVRREAAIVLSTALH